MEQLLQDMPITKADGSLGLLHHGTFGDAVHSRLPQYDVSKITDSVCVCVVRVCSLSLSLGRVHGDNL